MSVWTDLERLLPAVREDLRAGAAKHPVDSRVIVLEGRLKGRVGHVAEQGVGGYYVKLLGSTHSTWIDDPVARDYLYREPVLLDGKVYAVAIAAGRYFSDDQEITVVIENEDGQREASIAKVEPFPLSPGDRVAYMPAFAMIGRSDRAGIRTKETITGVIAEIKSCTQMSPGCIIVERDDARRPIKLGLELYQYLGVIR
jgi:hypothetical protein